MEPTATAPHAQRSARSTEPSGARLLRFTLISLLLHGVLFAALMLTDIGLLRTKLDLVWLDMDNKLGAPQPAQLAKAKTPEPPARKAVVSKPPPEKKRARAKAAAKPQRKKARRHRATAKRKRRRFSTRRVALTRMTPGDAALMLLLRMDRIRRSPYARSVRRLLSVFYDFKALLWTTDLDVVKDFKALLIATPNPYRVTRTFLAIRHDLPRARLEAAFQRSVSIDGGTMHWSRSPLETVGTIPSPPRLRSDPRRVYLRRGLAMLAAAAQRSLLDKRADKQKGQKTALSRLRDIDNAGGASGDSGLKPGLLLQAINLPRLIRLPGDIPMPSNVQVTVPARAPAVVRGVLTFASPADPQRFLAAVRPRITRARGSLLLRVMGIASMLDRLVLTARGAQVEARIKLGREEVIQLLDLFRSAIPQVYVPGMKPRLGLPGNDKKKANPRGSGSGSGNGSAGGKGNGSG
ncbi:MAG: hypothetical protein KC503_25360 [Myxococcales bacterium]|nr:hypothetical protein [Myxococcales bacterium]